jgi:DNA-binding transcriptional ArsR family regulator
MKQSSYEIKSSGQSGENPVKKGSTKICYKFFNNLANPTRLAALEMLMSRPMSVNELASSLGQEQSMVSHNLKPLLKCNFVCIQKQGKKRVYSANQETIGTIFAVIENHAEKYCPSEGRCLNGEN